jgi:Flp pilus assembly pilin Flp
MFIHAEVHQMTVLDRNPEPAIESMAVIERSRKQQRVIAINRATHSNPNHTNQGEHTMSLIKNFFIEEDGQDMVEYGLVIALVVIATASLLGTFNKSVSDAFVKLGGEINAKF